MNTAKRERERGERTSKEEEEEKKKKRTQLNHDRFVVRDEQKEMDNHYPSSEA
jgi:hypothetical protein